MVEEKQPDPEPITDGFGWGSWGASKKKKKKGKSAENDLRGEETTKAAELESAEKARWGSTWGTWAASSVSATG
jgi:hypothetical protein